MDITYELEKQDFLTYQLFTASKSERIRKKRNRNRVIFPLLYLGLGLFFAFTFDYPAAVAFFIIALLWLLFYPAYERKRYRTHYLKHIEEHYQNRIGISVSLSIEDDHFFTKDPAAEARINYSEIHKIVEIRDHLFIRISTGVSLIIPKRVMGFDDFKMHLLKIAERQEIEHITELDWAWK